jgi:hypothetical protein
MKEKLPFCFTGITALTLPVPYCSAVQTKCACVDIMKMHIVHADCVPFSDISFSGAYNIKGRGTDYTVSPEAKNFHAKFS